MRLSRSRGALLKRRDDIIRTALIAHPMWTTAELLNAVSPAIAGAGLKPIGLQVLRHQLCGLRRRLDLKRTWFSLSAAHTKFMKEQLADDSTQTTESVWRKFCVAFGHHAEDRTRIARWWYNTVAHVRRRSARRTASTSHEDTSIKPSDEAVAITSPVDLPTEWWTLGEEFDAYLSPRASDISVPHTHGAGSEGSMSELTDIADLMTDQLIISEDSRVELSEDCWDVRDEFDKYLLS